MLGLENEGGYIDWSIHSRLMNLVLDGDCKVKSVD